MVVRSGFCHFTGTAEGKLIKHNRSGYVKVAYVEDYYLLRKEDEIYGVISIVNGKVYINQTSFIGKIVLTKSFNQQVLKDFIGSVLINYKNEVKKDSKKIRISFENKDTEIYKELIQSLIELSFIKVAELKDELTIGQDVLIYDYFY